MLQRTAPDPVARPAWPHPLRSSAASSDPGTLGGSGHRRLKGVSAFCSPLPHSPLSTLLSEPGSQAGPHAHLLVKSFPGSSTY